MRPLVALGVLGLAFASAQPSALSTEFDRLARDIVSSIPEADRGGIAARLERGRAALADGRLYLALFDLQPAFEGEAGYRLSGQAATFPNHEAFRARWQEMGAPPASPAGKAKVHFIEALAQSSDGRAAATYRASLPYAQDAGMAAGLYYLGESHAMTRFAALCRSVEARPKGPAPALNPVGPALRAYEATVVKAYDQAAQPLRPRFAQVHVAIKLAHTLEHAGHAEGALLQYLISRYRYALVQREGTPPPMVADVSARLKSTSLPAGADHSTAEFFLQLAAATLAAKEPMPHGAAAILDDIIPAYLELVKR
jgi:hypothetical protein